MHKQLNSSAYRTTFSAWCGYLVTPSRCLLCVLQAYHPSGHLVYTPLFESSSHLSPFWIVLQRSAYSISCWMLLSLWLTFVVLYSHLIFFLASLLINSIVAFFIMLVMRSPRCSKISAFPICFRVPISFLWKFKVFFFLVEASNKAPSRMASFPSSVQTKTFKITQLSVV